MLDKKQKSCVKRIHLVTESGLYEYGLFTYLFYGLGHLGDGNSKDAFSN